MTAPHSDDEIRGVFVGGLAEHTTIHLAGYDPKWPNLLDCEAERIRSAIAQCASSMSVQSGADAKSAVVDEVLAQALSA